MKGDVLVEFDGVSKRFGKTVVLDSFSYQFREGNTHVICGRSGAGKSTLIRCINYIEPIDSGSLRFEGLEVSRKTAREVRKRVAMVFQQFNLFPHLTILKNATLGPVHGLKKPRRDAEAAALELLQRVGIGEKARSYPAQLSGGQQQRAAIVRALSMEPDLILFDEPTSALDPEMIGEVLDVMKGIAHEGRSMIVVTHEMGFAREAADLVSFMEDGRFIETQPAEEFFKSPGHETTKRFLRQILSA